MNLKRGIGVSSGIAIAKVLKLENEKIKIKKDKVTNKKVAIESVQKAISQTIKEIKVLKQKANKNLESKTAAIFDAHIVLASDPMLMETIVKKINSDNMNALAAVDFAINLYSNQFAKMNDDYMKEKAIDVKDIGKRILDILFFGKSKDLMSINEESIIVVDDLTPSNTLLLDKKYVKGFLTNKGGITSHTAIISRSLQIPAVLGLKDITRKVKNNDVVAIDGGKGEVILNPSQSDIKKFLNRDKQYKQKNQQYYQFKGKKSLTKDGKQVKIFANISAVEDIEVVQDNDSEGIGLFRSEFLYMNSKNWPSEEEQFIVYKQILKSVNPKKVIIRTFDIGGDKILPYYKFVKEMNPFLGCRSIRFCLNKKDIFKTQLKALLRASIYGNLAIMFPMITTIDELIEVKTILKECQKELNIHNIKFSDKIEIGIMVETPAVVLLADHFAKYVDFFSIGTNDLIQYTMAADRMNEKLLYLYQPLNPSILNMIHMTINSAHKYGKWVSMCGEMASNTAATLLLIGLGLDEFSVSPSMTLNLRKLISQIDSSQAKKVAMKAINLETEDQVNKLVKNLLIDA